MNDQPSVVDDRSSDDQISAASTGLTCQDEGPAKNDTSNVFSTLSKGSTSTDDEGSSCQERERVKSVIETIGTSVADLRAELELIKAEKRAMAEEIKSLQFAITGNGTSPPEIPVPSTDTVAAPVSSSNVTAAPAPSVNPEAQRSNRPLSVDAAPFSLANAADAPVFSAGTGIRSSAKNSAGSRKTGVNASTHTGDRYGTRITGSAVNEGLHPLPNTYPTRFEAERFGLMREVEPLRDGFGRLRAELSGSMRTEFEVAAELQDRIRRSYNVLVFNVPDFASETPAVLHGIVNELLGLLELPFETRIVGFVKRLGRFGIRCRPIVIEFASQFSVRMVMRNKNRLRAVPRWRSIWIGEDLTEFQRASMKESHRHTWIHGHHGGM